MDSRFRGNDRCFGRRPVPNDASTRFPLLVSPLDFATIVDFSTRKRIPQELEFSRIAYVHVISSRNIELVREGVRGFVPAGVVAQRSATPGPSLLSWACPKSLAGHGDRIGEPALSLGERLDRRRRFSAGAGRAFARRRVMHAQARQSATARRRVRGQLPNHHTYQVCGWGRP